MPFDKKYLENLISIRTHEFPKILCPSCKKGTLEFDESNLTIEETAKSKKVERDEENYERIYREYIFSLQLKCDSPSCGESVMSVGDVLYDYENLDESCEYKERTILNPKFFYPTIELFKLDESIPEKIRAEISKSFSLFFTDTAACANKIRQSIEVLMDELGVVREKTKETQKNVQQSKPYKLNLFERIKEFKSKYSEVANSLQSIRLVGDEGSYMKELGLQIEEFTSKFTEVANSLQSIRLVGNEGSHMEELGLQSKDIIESYKLVEHGLDQIYKYSQTAKKKEIKESSASLKNRFSKKTK